MQQAPGVQFLQQVHQLRQKDSAELLLRKGNFFRKASARHTLHALPQLTFHHAVGQKLRHMVRLQLLQALVNRAAIPLRVLIAFEDTVPALCIF